MCEAPADYAPQSEEEKEALGMLGAESTSSTSNPGAQVGNGNILSLRSSKPSEVVCGVHSAECVRSVSS